MFNSLPHRSQCSCECHLPGVNVMHCSPCCSYDENLIIKENDACILTTTMIVNNYPTSIRSYVVVKTIEDNKCSVQSFVPEHTEESNVSFSRLSKITEFELENIKLNPGTGLEEDNKSLLYFLEQYRNINKS